MGAAVGGTNHIDYKGREREREQREEGENGKKFPAAPELRPVCVSLND